MEFLFSHNKKELSALLNLSEESSNPAQKSLLATESTIVRHFIDEYWKHHLQAMDDLKESVRNAVYEQKDPLLVYKFEALDIFKKMLSALHKTTITYLFQFQLIDAHITALKEKKGGKGYDLSQLQEIKKNDEEATETSHTPLKSLKVAGRNDRVTVKYPDGTIKKEVKFKTVAQDLEENRCVLV